MAKILPLLKVDVLGSVGLIVLLRKAEEDGLKKKKEEKYISLHISKNIYIR